MSYATQSTADKFLDNAEQACDSFARVAKTLMNTEENIAKSLRKNLAQLAEERERIDATIADLTRALERIEGQKAVEFLGDFGLVPKVEYTLEQRVNAVKAAIESYDGHNFDRNKILQIVGRNHPGMFSNTKMGQNYYNSVFWQVIRPLWRDGFIEEIEKGGGRKATLFRKART
jgi:hypothetical protein